MPKGRVAGIIGLLGVIGCGSPNVAATTGGLTIDHRTTSNFDGTFAQGDARLQFTATADDVNRHVTVTLEVAPVAVSYDVDYALGVGSFDSNGAVLTAANRATLEAFSQELGKTFAAGGLAVDTLPLIEDAVMNLSGHFAAAPLGEALPPFTFKNERSWTFLSCSCVNSWLANSNFSGYKRTGYCSSSSCPGRCGVGCGWDNTYSGWGSGKYTSDCALHDYGLGSWTAASDDYTFASYNCRW